MEGRFDWLEEGIVPLDPAFAGAPGSRGPREEEETAAPSEEPAPSTTRA